MSSLWDVYGMEPIALIMLGKYSATQLYPQLHDF